MAIPTYTPRPKVLIPEKVSPDGLALLKDSFDVEQKQGLSPDELKAIIGEYEALIVRSETKVTAELLNAAKKLKVVARAGVGVDNVDVKAATGLGIIVVNSPSGNINAAAEHTVACKFYFLFGDETVYRGVSLDERHGSKVSIMDLMRYFRVGMSSSWLLILHINGNGLTLFSDDGGCQERC